METKLVTMEVFCKIYEFTPLFATCVCSIGNTQQISSTTFGFEKRNELIFGAFKISSHF